MTKKKHRRYCPEFKRHALKRASADGVTDKGTCEDLGENVNTSPASPYPYLECARLLKTGE